MVQRVLRVITQIYSTLLVKAPPSVLSVTVLWRKDQTPAVPVPRDKVLLVLEENVKIVLLERSQFTEPANPVLLALINQKRSPRIVLSVDLGCTQTMCSRTRA